MGVFLYKKIDSVLLAKYMIQQAQLKGITDMSITKLQKMFYAFEGGLLANDIDIVDECCEAWEYGPIYPKIFTEIDPCDFNKNYDNLNLKDIDNHLYYYEIEKMMNAVLEVFGKYTAVQLCTWASRKGTPYSKTPKNKKINKLLIKDYFKNNMNEEKVSDECCHVDVEIKEYIKKPIKIQAVQYDGSSLSVNLIKKLDNKKDVVFEGDYLIIKTLEGDMKANKGDYIIKGVSGELYPCKPDIFEKTYDEYEN